ncbi:hypothetical protein EXM85_00040 [Clostridium botulinum]|nr:hypothetical protein [Clostridium botulinum]NFB69174.1 hypothetical protein [Clostridium botulinum]NFB96475.1 hypothetical protein [Clostridium botulinum]NFC46414.1 hypothetical protein [Clostridium botulinum]NFD21554.1 hypothetical protein [Clostridium botulinum]
MNKLQIQFVLLNSYNSHVDYYRNMVEANPQWSLVDIYVDEVIGGIQTDKRTEFQGMITFIFNSGMSHSLKGEDVVELDVDKNVEKSCSDTYGNCSETK